MDTSTPLSAHVLLVEDNDINQMVAEDLLSDLNITCDIAENGQEALDKLRAQPEAYALVLMDCEMPIMDGFSATQAIRNQEAGTEVAKIPIVAMTAHAMEGDREKCLQAGMTEYLAKPIDVEALQRVLQQCLSA